MWAKWVSYIIHPAIVPVLGVLLVKFILPYNIPDQLFYFTTIYVFVGTYLFPLIITFGMYKLNFVSSIHLKKASERKYPFIITALFYFLTARAIVQFNLPIELYKFIMAGCYIIIIQMLLLRYIKVSAHAAGAAAMLAWLINLSFLYQINLLFIIALAILSLSIVSSARLKLKAHNVPEIIAGIAVGFLCVSVFFWM